MTRTAYQDVAVFNDVTYTYKVQAVRRLGGECAGQPGFADPGCHTGETDPAAAAAGVLVVVTSQGVELRWEVSPAADLAGYRVYRRSTGEEKYTRLTPELLTKPYFVDSQVKRGQTYYYYVTAVDDSRRANESLPSETMSITS